MAERGTWFRRELESRGVTRRDFMGFCTAMAGMLGLPSTAAGQIAKAVAAGKKPTLVWLEFQDCAGNSESFLRAAKPTAAEVILDLLSLDYHETIMAAAGHRAEAALQGAIAPGGHIAVIEGSIPTGAGGAYCTIGGRAAIDIAREVCKDALAVVAIGTCAAFGGLPAASPNPTGALGVSDAVPGIKTLINLSACPANPENLTALLVYFLTYHRWPPTDRNNRPMYAYGKSIHDACERRGHFDAGQYAEMWGDEGHREGFCLYKLGCKGPVTFQNCPNIGWNDGTNWPVGCGHPCIGCAEPNFWDVMTPFYSHLSGIPGFSDATHIDTIGLVATAAVGTAFAGHALVQLGKRVWENRHAEAPPHVPAKAPDTSKDTSSSEKGGDE